jgi:hypothetical protein
MKKFAVFSNDKTTWDGKNFEGFLEARTEWEANVEIDKNWFSCDCDYECSCYGEEVLECTCEQECECSFWAVEVAMDVVHWNNYKEKFYTQLEMLEDDLKEVKDKVERCKARKEARLLTIAKMEEELLEDDLFISEQFLEACRITREIQVYKDSLNNKKA